MLSAVRGLAWEFLKYGWAQLLLSFLGAVSLPLFILVALKSKNALVPDDPGMVMIHSVFLHIGALIFAAPIFYVLGNPARLFCLPLTSRAIALSQMIPAFLLVAGQVVLYSLIINRIVGLDWPYVGPAMFLATAVVTFQAGVYLTQRSLWLVPVTGSLLLIEGLWFTTRYGNLTREPSHFWTEVTLGEWVLMIAALAGALLMGCYGLALNRCGESINTRKFEAWVLSWFETTPGGFPSFGSSATSQFWFEWKQKGPLLPGIVMLAYFLCIFLWAIVDRDVANLHYAIFLGGYVLSLFAFIVGLLFGNYGMQDARQEIGHFLASRPLTNRTMAGKTIQAALVSLGAAWLLWAAGFGALHLLMNALGIAPTLKYLEEVRWWFIPATLLLAWIALGAGMLVTITGRGMLYFQIGLSSYIFWLIGAVALNFVADSTWSGIFHAGCATVAGVVLMCWTIWLYLEALKKGYLGVGEIFAALAFFIALAAVATLGVTPRSLAELPFLLLGCGVIAMSVAPFAGAPLGLSWNRTH